MFKKIILLFLISILILTGCKDNNSEKEIINKREFIEVTEDEPTYTDDNPVVVGLYQNGNLIKDITLPFNYESDIAVFDVYYTNEESVGNNSTKYNFNRFYNNYEYPEKYKIGFYISFKVGDELKEATITTPDKTFVFNPYIFIYLYDDIHQPDGAWYSHVESMTDNTLFSSIKLTAIHNLNEITSPVTLTVFTYDTEDDFDEDGKYRGNSKYTININKQ